MTSYLHDPDAVLDYTWDWSSWLSEGETITSASVSAVDIALDAPATHDTSTVTAWFSAAVEGAEATATCHVETNQGREDDRTLKFYITER